MRPRVRASLGLLIGWLGRRGPQLVGRITKELTRRGLARPLMVYVYDFAVEQSEVKVDPGGPLQRLREGGGLARRRRRIAPRRREPGRPAAQNDRCWRSATRSPTRSRWIW
mgnify:CR=1 FL=1